MSNQGFADSDSSLQNTSQSFKWWGTTTEDRIDRILRYGGKTLLDIGCGNGDYVQTLSKKGYEAYGIDLDLHPLNQQLSHRIIRGSACYLPFEANTFDTVLLINILEHADDRKVLEEAGRVCRKNVIFSVPHEKEAALEAYGVTYHSYFDPTHRRYYTCERLADLLQSTGFRLDALYRTYPINAIGLLLHTLHVPHPLTLQMGSLLEKSRLVKNYYMNIEGVASKVKQ